MTTLPIEPARCPVCAGTNDCARARGENTCWCFDVSIPPAALAAVPAEARGRACLCRGCAGVRAEPASGDDASGTPRRA